MPAARRVAGDSRLRPPRPFRRITRRRRRVERPAIRRRRPVANLVTRRRRPQAYRATDSPLPSFGQPATSGYGAPPPYGSGPGSPYGGPPPSKNSALPFIIGGLVLLLVAGGVALFFVLNKDDPTPVATSSTSQSTVSTPDTGSPTEDTQSPTQDSDTGSPGGDAPNFAESEDVAIAFVQLMIDGNYGAALTRLCEDGRDPSDGDGFADPQALADDFFLELGATTVTGGETTGVLPSDIDRDVVSFDLETDIGVVSLDVQVLEEEVGADLMICGYDSV